MLQVILIGLFHALMISFTDDVIIGNYLKGRRFFYLHFDVF
jgi:hypothetical protein